jgi:2-methylcitrate dehydratase PrpD
MLGPRQLTEKRLADPQLLALARKVSVQVDEALNKVYPDKTASRVEIVFLNGEKIDRQVNIPKGDPRDPMAADDIADKVRFFAGNRDRKKTEQIIETVLHLESLPDIRTLTALIL